jgi:small subunit ribosomal protein S3
MGHKIHPVAVRLNENRTFDSSWYDDNYSSSFKNELLIRKTIESFFQLLSNQISNLILGRLFFQKSHQKILLTFFIFKKKKKDIRKTDKILINYPKAAFVPLLQYKKQQQFFQLSRKTTQYQWIVFQLAYLAMTNQKSIDQYLFEINSFQKYETFRPKMHPFLEHLENALSQLVQQMIIIRPILIRQVSHSAVFLAQTLAKIIEKQKIPYRRLKQVVRTISSKCLGIRVLCSGRLGGAEKAKKFFLKHGRTSLNIFSQRIDFARGIALTKYGIIGVKVWVSYR